MSLGGGKGTSVGFNQGEPAGLLGTATPYLDPPLCPKAPGSGLKAPGAALRLRFLAGLGLWDRGFLRRKGKGHTLGGQADGNSWQHWLPSSRAGLCLGR